MRYQFGEQVFVYGIGFARVTSFASDGRICVQFADGREMQLPLSQVVRLGGKT